MTAKDLRPKNLNLFTMHFPIMAIISILHRLSGVILFLLIPFFLWVFQCSLSTQQGFDDIVFFLSSGWVKFFLWLSLGALSYHMVAGARHLLMDLGIGESLQAGKLSSYITIGISVVLFILIGIWLW
ncbi:MAG: succinate dehydrogenase, cytochrome b556 subunit [Gammaproteobacteria bacterium]|nr:succinate dehydrogenase, cytochrome b556 subunit [Gammaproteobacteria bacterium]